MMLDALVIGGSYAGLSAALQLARARRRIAVVDAGQRRNRFVDASHGFLGQDGRSPAAIVADAKAQLLAYPNVSWRDGLAGAARRHGEGFEVEVAGTTLQARRLLLATGVADELPAVPAWPSAGARPSSIARIATATSCTRARSACWRAARCPCTMR